MRQTALSSPAAAPAPAPVPESALAGLTAANDGRRKMSRRGRRGRPGPLRRGQRAGSRLPPAQPGTGAGGEAAPRLQPPGMPVPAAPAHQRRACVLRPAKPAEGARAGSRSGGVCAPQTRARPALPGAVRVS